MGGKRSRVEKMETGLLVCMGLPDHGYEGIDKADRWSEPRDRGKLGGYLCGLEEERGSTWDCGKERHEWSREKR